VFDDNMCDTLMCDDIVQKLLMVEFVLRNTRKEAGKLICVAKYPTPENWPRTLASGISVYPWIKVGYLCLPRIIRGEGGGRGRLSDPLDIRPQISCNGSIGGATIPIKPAS
jgi:hypothetical protein